MYYNFRIINVFGPQNRLLNMNNDKSLQILLVEHDASNADLEQAVIKEAAFPAEVTHILTLAEIKLIADKKNYDVVLLDLYLPDNENLNTISKIQDMLPDVPIIVLTNLSDEKMLSIGLQTGVHDYLIREQLDAVQLRKTVQYVLQQHQILKESDSENKAQQTYLDIHDRFTGFPNQQFFLKYLQLIINKDEATKKSFALVLIEIHDIDKASAKVIDFKKSPIIKLIAENLSTLIEQEKFIARYSENKFVILLTKMAEILMIQDDIAMIQQILAKNIILDNQSYIPSYNMGISVYPHDGNNVELLIKNCEIALERSSERGIRQYEIYTKKLSNYTKNSEDSVWHSDLQFALERKEFFLLYQPQIGIAKNQVTAVEALLRWNHPKLGLVPPGRFISVAEDNNLIIAIENWVLEEVAKQYQAWKNQIKKPLPLRISVNISVNQFQQNNLIDTVQKILNKYQIPPKYLELELDEDIFLMQPEVVLAILKQLNKLHVQIAMDDFRLSYSSLSYLSHLPIHSFKLNMDFVQNNPKDKATSLIVESIIKLAHSLDLFVTAKGVETHEQFELLKQQNCDEVQGYYFSKPALPNFISGIINNNLTLEPEND